MLGIDDAQQNVRNLFRDHPREWGYNISLAMTARAWFMGIIKNKSKIDKKNIILFSYEADIYPRIPNNFVY